MSTNQQPAILVVEDDSNDALLLQRAFRRADLKYLLQIVGSGDEAICYLKGEGAYSDRSQFPLPSLTLMDLKMPGKTGLEVLNWIRNQSGEIKDLPVIILTSSRHSDDVDQAYALGANSYMAKPQGNFDGLAEMVKSLDLHV